MARTIEAGAELTLWTDALDNRGLMAQPDWAADEVLRTEQPRVIALDVAAREIGLLISPWHFDTEFLDEAPHLNVSNDDLQRVFPGAIDLGLYGNAPGVDPVVRIYGQKTDHDLPGIKPSDEGIRFHMDDHRRLAHSAVGIGKHSMSTTLSANPITLNSGDRVERNRKSHSAVAKSEASKILAIDKFDLLTQERRKLFVQIYQGMRVNPPVRYRPENALRLLMRADTELRRIVDTSSIGRGLEGDQPAAAQRALTFNLYQRGQTTLIWRAYAEMAGRYYNAQRGKLDESRKGCAEIFEQHKAHIKPDELEEFELIVSGIRKQQLALAA